MAIDGDDVGPQLRALVIANDIAGVAAFSAELIEYFASLRSILEQNHYQIIFCGGDSLLASTCQANLNFQFASLPVGPCTVSVGIGSTPEYAYLALQLAKARGKNQAVYMNTVIARTIHKWPNRKLTQD